MEIYNKLPHSNCYIELISKTVTTYGRDVVESNDDGTYTIEIAGKKITKDIEWFTLLSVFKPELPSEFIDRYDNIEFTRFTLPRRSSLEVPYMMCFKEPIEFRFDGKEFRVIPRFPHLAIDRNGILLHVDKKTYPYCATGGNREYIYYTIRDPMVTDHRIVVSLHRLLAMAWIPNDDWENKIIVDHIDGDKLNNSLNNLQWVSHSENIKRGVILRSKDMVFCRKVNEFTVHTFRSLLECSKFIGRSQINPVLTPIRPGRVWKGKNGSFYISYTPEDLQKRYELEPDPKYVARRNSGVEAFNIYSKEILYFDTPKEASSELGLGITSVMNRLYREDISKSPLKGWLVRPRSDSDWDFTVKYRESYPKKCILEDVDKGVKMKFPSIKQAGKFLRTSNHVINKHVKSGKPFERNGVKYKIMVQLPSDS